MHRADPLCLKTCTDNLVMLLKSRIAFTNDHNMKSRETWESRKPINMDYSVYYRDQISINTLRALISDWPDAREELSGNTWLALAWASRLLLDQPYTSLESAPQEIKISGNFMLPTGPIPVKICLERIISKEIYSEVQLLMII